MGDVSVEQLVVLALLLAAFAAGWVARGTGARGSGSPASPSRDHPSEGGPTGEVEAVPADEDDVEERVAGSGAAALPAEVARTRGRLALAAAIDCWLDDADAPTAEGTAAVAEVVAAADAAEAAGDTDGAALLREARAVLGAYLAGRPMDRPASRTLERIEDEL
jgi:hypothetical protein